MQTCQRCLSSRCPGRTSRRRFLTTAGVTAAAVQMDLFDLASSLFTAETKPEKKPRVGVVFLRRTKGGGCTWPTGTTEQLQDMQAMFTKTMADAAGKLGVQLDVMPKPLENVDAYLNQLKAAPPDGLIVIAMGLNAAWRSGKAQKLVQNRGDIPTIVYANVTAFTPNYLTVARAPKTYLGATQDVGWLAFAVRLLYTVWRMKSMRVLACPTKNYYDEFKKVEDGKELRALADFYEKNAKKIVEPKPADILEAVKHYIVLRRLVREGQYDGVTVRGPLCIGGKNPACVAVSRLLDEGIVAACEGDMPAAACQLLTLSLFDRPGFMGNPSPNTVNNTLIVTHCTSALKLDGIDKPYRAPFVLRDFHAMGGVAPMVEWPVGREATIMDLLGKDSMILGGGKTIANTESIAQPPCGGCRTSVEFELDGVADTLEVDKGHHKWCILENEVRPIKAYCQLAGIKVADLTGRA